MEGSSPSFFEKTVKDARLVFLILIYDLMQLMLFILQSLSGVNVTVNLDWVDLLIKVIMVTALYQVLRNHQQLAQKIKYRMMVWDYIQEQRYKDFVSFGMKFTSEEAKQELENKAYKERIAEDFQHIEQMLFSINPKLSREDVMKIIEDSFPFLMAKMEAEQKSA